MSGLPTSWTIKMSRSRGREYYFNTETHESSWNPPPGTDMNLLKQYLNSDLHQSEQIRCAHLLIKHAGSRRPRSWKNENITISKEEAIEILKKHQETIKSGKATLQELASTESDCSSHSNGGDLGVFGRGAMQPAFEKAAFALQVGELSDIVESDSGVHLILRTA